MTNPTIGFCNRLTRRRRGTSRAGLTWFEFIIILAISGVTLALLLPAGRNARPAAQRTQCMNNLKQIGIALHNYHDAWSVLPPAYTVDSKGRPLHSWRTLILPFLDQQELYESIDLSKPWDDPSNAIAFGTSPNVYRCPSADIPQAQTTYMAFVGSDKCFSPTDERQLSEITDETSQSLMVIDVSPDEAVHWMSPRDTGATFFVSLGRETKLAHLGGVQVTLADGSVKYLSVDLPVETRRALMTIAGDDPIDDW